MNRLSTFKPCKRPLSAQPWVRQWPALTFFLFVASVTNVVRSQAPSPPSAPDSANPSEVPSAEEQEGTDVAEGPGLGQASDEANSSRGETEEEAYDEELDEAEELDETPEPSTVPRTLCDGRIITAIGTQGLRRVAEEDVLVSLELRKGQRCSDAVLSSDVKALWDLGFFSDIAVDAKPRGEGVALTFILKERPSIAAIEFNGNDELDEEELTEAISISEDSILSESKVQQQVMRLRDAYAEKGFFLAKVTYRLVPKGADEVTVAFDIIEGENVVVRHVRFVGNRFLTDEKIKSAMQTRETGFWSFFSSNNAFQNEAVEQDRTRLQVLYYDNGFLNVDIGIPTIELSPDRRFIDITVPIKEGPRFRVGQVNLEELNSQNKRVLPLGGRRHLLNKVTLKRGDWFSRATIAKNILDIQRFYRDRGYARAQVQPITKVDEKKRRVDLLLQIRRGELVRIGRIEISGNTTTRDGVIRREMKIAEGDLYSQSALETSKERITALGYFERVDFAEETGKHPNSVNIAVTVVERPTGQFQIGAGFSSLESFIFTSQVQQQNLFGRGQSLSLQLQVSGLRQLAQVSFIEPWFLDSRWTLGVDGYKTIRQFQAFSRDSTGGSVSLGHPIFFDELRFFVQYRGELVDISSRSGGLFGFSGGGSGFGVFQRLPLANLFRDGFTSSLRFSLTWDSRNNRLFPSEGIYASASTEYADSFLGSQNSFIRYRTFGRFYKSLFAGVVFKVNTEWGLITTNQPQGVPIFERFFLGGILNVRGFPFFGLGPRAGVPAVTDPNAGVSDRGVVIGGNMQAFYNAELEFPIIEVAGIRGVIFTDGGNTWNTESVLCQVPPPAQGDDTTDPCRINPLDIRTSWGFGLRWLSPLGPLRFEWGVPFSPRSYEQNVVFEFTIGNFF